MTKNRYSYKNTSDINYKKQIFLDYYYYTPNISVIKEEIQISDEMYDEFKNDIYFLKTFNKYKKQHIYSDRQEIIFDSELYT